MPPSPPPIIIGDAYVFHPSFGKGHGENARGMPLSKDMSELDLKPGTQTILFALDNDSGAPVIQWTDLIGNPRLTTIDLTYFGIHFTHVGKP